MLVVASIAAGCGAIPGSSIGGNYVGVNDLHAICRLPGRCEQPLECEGKIALVKGRIDSYNVFDRSRFPSLPYEKFTLLDANGSKALEVWVHIENNQEVFEKIALQSKNPARQAYVRGRIVGVDMQMEKACARGFKLEITSPGDLRLEEDE